jgi:transposase-like protein
VPSTAISDTVDSISKDRDPSATKHFIRNALDRHGRPGRITIDGPDSMQARLQIQVSADITLAGIELVQMMRKQQGAFVAHSSNNFRR